MGSYKFVPVEGTVAEVTDAVAALMELGEEAREIFENAQSSEGLANTQRIITFGETADVLENIQEPDIPEGADEIKISYSGQVHKNKRKYPSRAIRCSNACAILQGACEGIDAKIEELEDSDSDDDSAFKDELESLKSEIEEIISECESVEFPGMFG